MPSVYIVGPGVQFEAMFEARGWSIASSIEEASFVQFTGGADVSPIFYGEESHPRTMSDIRRDNYEAAVYEQCVRSDKKMLGVCRGAQFLNVMNGGTLFQHVDGHALADTHECFSKALHQVFNVTSTHHQMMRPSLEAEVEGVAHGLSTYKEHIDEDGVVVRATNNPVEVEVLFYSMTNTLCFQPHPEYHGAYETESYYFQLIHHYFGM